VNAIELDLKDESGVVGFPADARLARRAGAVRDIYDLAKAVRELHRRGIRVIGRLVCFRDPVLAAVAWKRGHRDQVIQTPSHRPYAGYGGFTNFANSDVRRYNIEIAVAAAKLGVDDILYDYVRRPDGPIASMRFPGLGGPPEAAIVRFLHESRLALRPYGTYLGASVFGVAATRPREIAQPIASMAREIDYVAPMVYPSHWGRGEYGVANPNSQPYDIVLRSLRDFRRDVAGSGARIVPWLQDFSLGVPYGPGEVRAQIRAARRDGINEFILWDPAVTYTETALAPKVSTIGLTTATPKPNELGEIPVIMHHEIRPDRIGPYDQTPAEFRSELERLWREGYYPVTTEELVDRKLGRVPRGKTPVVLTFDDSTRYQLFFRGRKLVRTTAVGVLLQFARTHPGFRATGSMYVLREPFAGVPQGAAWLRWLVDHGFELGNHTYDHLPLNRLRPAQVARELALGEKVITDAVPGYSVKTMSLPLGAMPTPAILASRGEAAGRSYGPYGVLLVGANPAPSPYSRTWNPAAIPRIRSSHAGWKGEQDFGASYWLRELAEHPDSRYVSDGDPRWVTFPRSRMPELAPRFRSRARPY
jgi:peptidoglycan/xylan/chitin deacetylase (PgdA/CDA1 family)